MKQLLLTILLLISFSLNAQEIKVVEVNLCETGTEKAVADFSKGIYKIYSFGWAPQPANDFEVFSNNYLLEKYNIQVVSMGCVIMPSDDCYNKKMNALLLNKYGDNLFEQAKKDARIQFEKIKN
ncbi:FEKKY domain-containing protein [Psychroserpens sp. MEBiC05023]